MHLNVFKMLSCSSFIVLCTYYFLFLCLDESFKSSILATEHSRLPPTVQLVHEEHTTACFARLASAATFL